MRRIIARASGHSKPFERDFLAAFFQVLPGHRSDVLLIDLLQALTLLPQLDVGTASNGSDLLFKEALVELPIAQSVRRHRDGT